MRLLKFDRRNPATMRITLTDKFGARCYSGLTQAEINRVITALSENGCTAQIQVSRDEVKTV